MTFISLPVDENMTKRVQIPSFHQGSIYFLAVFTILNNAHVPWGCNLFCLPLYITVHGEVKGCGDFGFLSASNL